MTLSACGDEINHPLTPVAVVGLEQTFYSISEHGRAVEVCVVVHMPDIDCPIKFPFTVLLSTTDFSAGNALIRACTHSLYITTESPMDYGTAVKTVVQFDECERRSCINIPIVDDEVPENTEYFNLTLERNGLHERIQLHPVDGVVQITDNDGMCTVLFAWSMYQRPSVVWLIQGWHGTYLMCVARCFLTHH